MSFIMTPTRKELITIYLFFYLYIELFFDWVKRRKDLILVIFICYSFFLFISINLLIFFKRYYDTQENERNRILESFNNPKKYHLEDLEDNKINNERTVLKPKKNYNEEKNRSRNKRRSFTSFDENGFSTKNLNKRGSVLDKFIIDATSNFFLIFFLGKNGNSDFNSRKITTEKENDDFSADPSHLITSEIRGNNMTTIIKNNKAEEEINNLRNKIDLLQNQINDIHKKEDERDREIKFNNQNEIETAVKNISNSTIRKNKELKKEIETLKIRNRQLEDELTRMQFTSQNGNQAIIENMTQIKELNENLKNLVRSKDIEIEQLRVKNEDKNQQLRTEKERNSDLRKKLEEKEEETKKIIENLGTLNNEEKKTETENYKLRQTNLFLFNLLTDNYKAAKEVFYDNNKPEETMAADRLIEYIQELKKNSYRMNNGLSDDNMSLLRRDHDVVVDGMQNMRKSNRNGLLNPGNFDVENNPKYKVLKQKYEDLLRRNSNPSNIISRPPPVVSHPGSPIQHPQPIRRINNLSNFSPSPNPSTNNITKIPYHNNNITHNILPQTRLTTPYNGHSNIIDEAPRLQHQQGYTGPLHHSNNMGVSFSPNTRIINRGMPVTNRNGMSPSPVRLRVEDFTPSASPSPIKFNEISRPQNIPPKIVRNPTAPTLIQPRISTSSNNNNYHSPINIPRSSNSHYVHQNHNTSLRYDSRYTSINSGGGGDITSSGKKGVRKIDLIEEEDEREDFIPSNLLLRGKPIKNKQRNRIVIDGSPTSTLNRDNSQESMWNRAMAQ